MNFRFYTKDRSCWKELDEQIIYYQNDTDLYKYSKELRFMNVGSEEIMEYFTIAPKSLGLLNKYDSYLNIFIETQSSTLIARLYTNPLKIKITYRIFQEHLYHFGPIYDFSHNILQILQNRRLIQLSKNKLIRKYDGSLEKQIHYGILARMGLRSFNLFRQNNQFFLDQIEQKFESIFNISLNEIDKNLGTHIFKKIGNFIILKKQNRYQNFTYLQSLEEIPVYYVSMDDFVNGNGVKGMIQLGQCKTLKLIKQFNKGLYAVISFETYFLVNEIRNGQLKLIYSLQRQDNLKKPILQLQHLIATNKNDCFKPQIHLVDLQKYVIKKL